MREILNIRMLSVRAALLAVVAAGLMMPSAQGQNANQNQKSDKQASGSSQVRTPSAGSKAAEEESAPANKEHAGGPQEGIKIHGHWVIDVRNPDGKLVTHREFENALSNPQLLSLMFIRQAFFGLWAVELDDSLGLPVFQIIEPQDPTVGVASKNLTLSTVGSSAVLSGSFTSTTSATITSVITRQAACATPPCTYTAIVAIPFSGTALSPGVSVAPGQILQVTVTYSYS